MQYTLSVGPGDPCGSIPIQNVVWFCDSEINARQSPKNDAFHKYITMQHS